MIKVAFDEEVVVGEIELLRKMLFKLRHPTHILVSNQSCSHYNVNLFSFFVLYNTNTTDNHYYHYFTLVYMLAWVRLGFTMAFLSASNYASTTSQATFAFTGATFSTNRPITFISKGKDKNVSLK